MEVLASGGSTIQNVTQIGHLNIGSGELGAELKQLMAVLFRAQRIPAQLVTSSPAFSYDAPFPVSNQVHRDNVVAKVLAQMHQCRMLALVAEPGFGKTQLGLMLSASYTHTWVRLRHRSADEAVSLVAHAAEHAIAKGHSLVVLDDLGRLADSDALSEEFLSLARKPFKVLITSAFSLPARLRSALGGAYVELPVPPFSQAETRQLLGLSGAPVSLLTDAIVEFIQSSTTQGHPWLLQAMVTYLQQRNWKLDEKTLRGIFQGEHAAPIRESARQMLRETVPDETARELLYRLDFVLGNIASDQIDAVAAIPRPVLLPIEKLREMRGLWTQLALLRQGPEG